MKIEQVLRDRLNRYGAYDIDFQRIGVTKKQVDDFDIPTDLDAKTKKKLLGDETKKGDSNVKAFIKNIKNYIKLNLMHYQQSDPKNLEI
jgi:hypothetical protein